MSLFSRGGQGGYVSDPELARLNEQNNVNSIANNTADIVFQQRVHLDEQRRTNNLLQLNTALAFQANAMLDEIAGSLNNLGYVLKDMAATAQRAEGLQREQVDVQRQQLRVSQQQLALQQKHFGTVERERIVKEMLYQLEKLLTFVDGLSDPQAKAYWSMRQLREISWRGFTTKDVSDINDKRLFDQLTSKAKQLSEQLSEAERSAVEVYLKHSSDYERLRQTPDDANVPPPKMHKKIVGNTERPSPPRVGNGEWTSTKLKQLGSVIDTGRTNDGYRKVLSGITGVGLFVLWIILSATVLHFLVAGMLVVVLIVVCMALIKNTFPSVKEVVRKRFGIVVPDKDDALVFLGQKANEIRTYLGDLEAFDRTYQELSTEAAELNAKADEHNRKRQHAIAVHAKRRESMMESLLGSIDAFAKQHPDVFRPA